MTMIKQTLAILIFSVTCNCQITFDNADKNSNTGGVTSVTVSSFSLGSGSGNNRLVVCMLGSETPGGADWSDVTFNSTSTPYTITEHDFGNATVGMAYFLDTDLPASSGSYDVVLTSSATVNELFLHVISVTGSEQAAHEAYEPLTINSSSDDISDDITTITDDAWVFTTVTVGDNRTFTPDGNGHTERTDVAGSSAASAAGTVSVASAGLITLGWTPSSSVNRIGQILAAWAPAGSSQAPKPQKLILIN